MGQEVRSAAGGDGPVIVWISHTRFQPSEEGLCGCERWRQRWDEVVRRERCVHGSRVRRRILVIVE